jgi:hypothetical protein
MPQDFAEKWVQISPFDSIGLKSREAEERPKRFGTNDPPPARRQPTVTELFLLLVNPLARGHFRIY